jgi:predicted RNA-binding Zn-ribbon protein involved in translation (DUF1610 family)
MPAIRIGKKFDSGFGKKRCPKCGYAFGKFEKGVEISAEENRSRELYKMVFNQQLALLMKLGVKEIPRYEKERVDLIIKLESPLDSSRVAYGCPKCGAPVYTKRRL